MQVVKWGDSLAVCLPDAVVEALQLKEGDEITVEAGERSIQVARDRTKRRPSRACSPSPGPCRPGGASPATKPTSAADKPAAS